MYIKSINETTMSFKARIGSSDYWSSYKENDFNGKNPDEFILSRIAYSKNPDGNLVLDLGAGQGRNSIPIARAGNEVRAFEINKLGRGDLVEKAILARVSDKIKVFDKNILDGIKVEKEANFAFMSHVSQHLNIAELQRVFENVHEAIKKGGEFILDVLIRQNDKYKRYDMIPQYLSMLHGDIENYGAASFKKEDILNVAKNAELEFILDVPFKEMTGNRAKYETQSLWGGLSKFQEGHFIHRKPVKLRWLVFKKL